MPDRAQIRRLRRRTAHLVWLMAAIAAAVVTLTASRPSQAQTVVLDPTNLIQNLIAAIQSITEVAQQVQQLSNEASQIQNQIQQLQDMADQAAQIRSPSWGQVQVTIAALTNAANVGRSLIYSLPGLQAQFQSQYPGYVPPTNWIQQSQQLTQVTLDTLNGTLRSAGMNAGDYQSVESALAALRSTSDRATGRNELMQVANSLASLQVEEMTKLRQLLALEINARNVWQAHGTTSEAAAEAALDRFIGSPGAVANPASSAGGFNP